MRAEIAIREGVIDGIKREFTVIKMEQNDALSKYNGRVDEKCKQVHMKLVEESHHIKHMKTDYKNYRKWFINHKFTDKSIKFINLKIIIIIFFKFCYDQRFKKLAEQLHHDKSDRKDIEEKSKASFNEIKETIEAIQWILTETMRSTSDLQILTKKQQLKMRQLEKKTNEHNGIMTDAEVDMPNVANTESSNFS